MHYFKFNIATWIQSTRHLSPQDEGIYLRLINHYYDTEGSFPVNLKPVLKRLQLLQYADSVDEILSDFFVLTDKGWQHNKCNELLKEFKKSAKKNKVNGAKGGRPAKAKALSVTQKEPNGLPVGTQPEPKHNPNYELRTKNQELETKNYELGINNQELETKKKSSKEKNIVELKPDDGAEIFKFWQATMDHPRSAYDSKRKALIKKHLKHYSIDDCKKAIHGCSVTPHNMGDNREGRIYDSFELIFRDSKHIDDYMRNSDKPPAGNIKTIEQTNNEAQAQVDRVKKHLGFDNE